MQENPDISKSLVLNDDISLWPPGPPFTTLSLSSSLGQGRETEGEEEVGMEKMKLCVMPTIRNTRAKVNDLERKISETASSFIQSGSKIVPQSTL